MPVADSRPACAYFCPRERAVRVLHGYPAQD
nr:MAG TPA: hypothetical protein [Caudoviricetes sp.]